MQNDSPIKEILLTCLGAGVWSYITRWKAPYFSQGISTLLGLHDAYGIVSAIAYWLVILLITCSITFFLYKKGKYFILGAMAFSFAQVVALLRIL